MGAAEWTGYTSAAPTYQTYSTLSTGAAAPTTASSYGYDSTGMVDHPSNYHIPTGKLRPFSLTTSV